MHGLMLVALVRMLSLDSGHLTISVPPDIQVESQALNLDVLEYDLYDSVDAPLLKIIVGGKRHDVSGFSQTCLNASPAWFSDDGAAGTVIVGEPGSWTIEASWDGLSGERLIDAHTIISSIRTDIGPRC
jgi:hypothetical protein